MLNFYPAMRDGGALRAGEARAERRKGRKGGRGGRGGKGRKAADEDGRGSEKVDAAAPPSIEPATFDMVVLDPPTLTKTKFGAVDIENDYQSLAKPSALCVSRQRPARDESLGQGGVGRLARGRVALRGKGWARGF